RHTRSYGDWSSDVCSSDLTDQSAIDAGVTLANGSALPAGKTISRAVLAGDANLDGTVDFFDIAQVLGYKYNKGTAASYTDGDLRSEERRVGKEATSRGRAA